MSFILRPYQTQAKNEIYQAWNNGVPNILCVMPTGSGKTVLVSEIFHEHKGAAVAIAHRQELVSQLSVALARQGVYHNLIAAANTVKFISSYHTLELGQSFFHPQAPITVAGVDTLLNRDLGQWAHQVTMWMQDEAHHVLNKASSGKPNKWGKAAALFPNARGLGMTATPIRADGKGLGRHSHGLFDHMIEGPTMRELITMGNLTDYRIFAPREVIDMHDVSTSAATGDFNQHQLREANHKSEIIGDIVDQYCRIAAGKLGVTFTVDIETATGVAERYRQMGIPAEVVSSKTPDRLRVELVSRFRRRELLQLVNVDLFGEGFDLPAIEVVSMGRHTQSKALAYQQFGRALRPMEGKERAIIIDHVGNFASQSGPGRHSLPDKLQTWSLDARERGTRGKVDDTVTPVTACQNCMSVYERILTTCPFCGHRPEPKGRAKPEQVEGNLYELTPEALAELRGEVIVAQEDPDAMKTRLTAGGLAPVVVNSQVKLKREQHESLDVLIENINWWGAHHEANGDTREEAYKRFFHRFGMDVLTAQALNRKDADTLCERIIDDRQI